MTRILCAILFLSLPAVVGATTNEISGQVTAAPGLELKPGGVLYIFAKEEGKPMPVAVLRAPNPKLPHKFSLSAKDAMVPGTPFVGTYILTARYSPSGDAMDKTGPEAISAKTNVGRKDVKLELKAQSSKQ